jgi:MFS family permease
MGNNSRSKIISPTVLLLSLVSLFTDMASEMLYPIMPLFLREIGYSVLLIGIIEGIAEAVAGLSKGYFGKLSDAKGSRLPFVQLGYSLSAISKPMMALLIHPAWVLSTRILDRIGKGIRTGARDALLSDQSTKETKATVFGFHRSMDTLGAVIGPSLALLYLYFYPSDYKKLFLFAFIPGVLAIITTLLIKEKKAIPKASSSIPSFWSFTAYFNKSSVTYKKLLVALCIIALVNGSDAFLLLQLKAIGLPDTAVIGLYILYNLVYALLAYPIGIIADKIGLKKIFILGWLIFVLVYVGFAFATQWWVAIVLMCLYGTYAAATEGIAKAWITNIVPSTETASALGSFSGFQSIATMFASILTGFIWLNYGASASFLCTACVALLVVVYLYCSKLSSTIIHK